MSPPSLPPQPEDDGKPAGLRRELSLLARRGPASLAASTLPGLVNYAIIVFLAYEFGMAQAGEYRLFYSLFAMCGILTLIESAKLVVRASAEDDGSSLARTIKGRFWFVVTVVVAGAVAWGLIQMLAPNLITWKPRPIHAVIAAAALLHYLTDSWMPLLQAKNAFGRIFSLAVAKYAGALVVFGAILAVTKDVDTAVVGQFGAMAAFNLICFLQLVRPALARGAGPAGPRALATPELRETLVISAANGPANAIEHVDKIIIGAVFGLEALGLYTLSVSTGRLIYNGLKPSLYVYYRRFTQGLPSERVLLIVGLAFTLVGAICAIGYWLAVSRIPSLFRFQGGEAIAAAVFIAYGVNMADSVYSQAYAINKGARSMHLLYANALSCLVVLGCFIGFAALPPAIALIAFASAYGIRHALTLLMLIILRRRQVREGPTP